MGRDITAYKRVDFVRPEYDQEGADPSLWNLYPNPSFVAQADGLAKGLYRVSIGEGEKVGFRAGSYSGYNDWRDWLCRTFHGITAEAFYRQTNPTGLFAALIDFSDCEGIIGPQTSARLAAEFHANRPRAVRSAADQPEDGDWYIGQYDRWAEAFTLAAGAGVVSFH